MKLSNITNNENKTITSSISATSWNPWSLNPDTNLRSRRHKTTKKLYHIRRTRWRCLKFWTNQNKLRSGGPADRDSQSASDSEPLKRQIYHLRIWWNFEQYDTGLQTIHELIGIKRQSEIFFPTKSVKRNDKIHSSSIIPTIRLTFN